MRNVKYSLLGKEPLLNSKTTTLKGCWQKVLIRNYSQPLRCFVFLFLSDCLCLIHGGSYI